MAVVWCITLFSFTMFSKLSYKLLLKESGEPGQTTKYTRKFQ